MSEVWKGRPNPQLMAAVLAELSKGGTAREVGDRLHISRETVLGYKWRAGRCVPAPGKPPIPLTSGQRLDALGLAMDRVLAETAPVLRRDRAEWREKDAAAKREGKPGAWPIRR